MTDVELDARVTALEENDGSGNYFNGKINITHVFKLPLGPYVRENASEA